MKKLLIVVDFQNDFVTGSLGNDNAVAITDNIKNKIESYLKDNHDLIYTLDTHYDNYLETKEGALLPVMHCIDNTFGHQVVKECDYTAKAVKIFKKPTFPSLELALYLKEHPYDEIELCGVVSNICVLSNAVMVKSVLPNAKIVVDVKCTASHDLIMQEKAFDVLENLHIELINR